MLLCKTKSETRLALSGARSAVENSLARPSSVGLVPTMGALHDGHLSLIRRAVAENDVTVVSIFVNPTQFSPSEDLGDYPQPLENDLDLCRTEGVDVVFAPSPPEMYDPDFSTWVDETSLSKGLCGASRPSHFRGVTTIVAKLFNVTSPDRAYFGQKDAQQAAVIKRFVRDLDVPVDVVVCPIVRRTDGLAMSSRNASLTPPLREEALVLSDALDEAVRLFNSGQIDTSAVKTAMTSAVSAAPHARIDYIEIVDAETLAPLETIDRPALVALAVFFADTRLIDNRILTPPKG